MDFSFLKSAPFPTYKNRVNYTLLPVNIVSVEVFNELVKYFNELFEKGEIKRGIVRTSSGGISTNGNKVFFNNYEVNFYGWGVELLVLSANVKGKEIQPLYFRVQHVFSQNIDIKKENESEDINGRQAFRIFKKELFKDGINIDDYFIENGEEIKKEIPKPLIKIDNPFYKDVVFYNAHHLDIKSSYPYGMACKIPEWRPTIERLFKKRKEEPVFKKVLNLTCGFFQSVKLFKANLAHISKYAIELNNERILNMAEWLKKNGRQVLAFNTDGIWFEGESVENEIELGFELGDFNQDHKNCKIRFKSDGAYEFVEDGIYYAVVRGKTKLDNIKPRSEWKWGDIYQDEAKIIHYEIEKNGKNYGIIKERID